ncbi:Uncharacterized protein APZ42_018275 [Daphnia magna]|uniref:Uncharacterized protein n=1 Tax=Daphnia magna TaxID=35525 RepID=A0A164Z821_9CRUS|nr:Uncharacterized protein APZ42_018275 [Daphnia magna]
MLVMHVTGTALLCTKSNSFIVFWACSQLVSLTTWQVGFNMALYRDTAPY